jgi:hypothetical protein
MAVLWKLESYYISRTVARLYKVLLFTEWMGQSSKVFPHYKKRDWPSWQSLEPGTKNVLHLPLVESSNILLPPLHIKVGVMKNFVKVMDQTGPAFTHLTEKFPGISAAKTKSCVFVSPQIRKIFRDKQLHRILSCNERRAWNDFRPLATNFVGYNKADNYNKLMGNLLLYYQKLDCTIFKDRFPGKLWGTERWASWMFSSWYLGNGEDIAGQMVFSYAGELLLYSNRRFCWTCVQTAGEKEV